MCAERQSAPQGRLSSRPHDPAAAAPEGAFQRVSRGSNAGWPGTPWRGLHTPSRAHIGNSDGQIDASTGCDTASDCLRGPYPRRIGAGQQLSPGSLHGWRRGFSFAALPPTKKMSPDRGHGFEAQPRPPVRSRWLAVRHSPQNWSSNGILAEPRIALAGSTRQPSNGVACASCDCPAAVDVILLPRNRIIGSNQALRRPRLRNWPISRGTRAWTRCGVTSGTRQAAFFEPTVANGALGHLGSAPSRAIAWLTSQCDQRGLAFVLL
jgi:hypothetical protein